MSKNAVTDWSTTAASNTDIGGISLAEGVMLPSAVNNAIREMMAQIATGVVVKVAATTTVAAYFQLAEATNNGTNKLTITPAASLTADRTATFPDLSGTVLYADAAQTVSAVHTFSAVPVMSGGAVQFPATQVASSDPNALDDYEEGTWTPAFSATGCTFSYATQYGGYRKIGSLVTVWGELVLNTSGNTLAANALSITGLPFTPAASPTRIPLFSEWSLLPTNYVQLLARISGSSATMAVVGNTAAGGNTVAQNASIALSPTLGSTFRFSGQYIV